MGLVGETRITLPNTAAVSHISRGCLERSAPVLHASGHMGSSFNGDWDPCIAH